MPTDEQLRQLVERWKREYEKRKHEGEKQRAWGMAHDNCAEELREVINNE